MTQQSGEPARLEVVDGVATLTLDDPDRRNAASAAMSRAVAAACESISTNPDVRVVVLTGAGPAFSAGGDLDALASGAIRWTEVYRGFDAVASLAVPVLVAVNGPAVGAGANFALAGDVVLAARSAWFDTGFLDIGMHPGGGYLWSMQRRIGAQATAATALFGERLDAEQARELGLVWRVVDDGELLPLAHAMAARVAARPSDLTRRTKAALRAGAVITTRRLAVDLEEVGQRWSVTRPAFAEGVAAMKARITQSRN